MLCGIKTGSTVHLLDKHILDYLENFSPQTVKTSSRCTNKKLVKMARPGEDYDAFQPCFFEADLADQEFYDAPAPSEDIWKKFELLPTPPRSPKHEPLYPSLPCPNTTMDNLQMVSDILDSDASYLTETTVDPLLQSPLSSGAMSPGAFSSCGSTLEESDIDSDMSCAECCALTSTCLRCIPLGSKLIQDCMWSGLNLPQELKPSSSSSQKSGTSFNRSNSTCSVDSGRSRSSLSESCDTINSADCVDPTAVFPFPVNECSLKARVSPSLDLHENLGAETPSDSEDEEIDVVTVGEKKVQYQKVITTTPGLVSVMTLRKRSAQPSPSRTPVSSSPASPVAAPPMSNSSMCAQVAAMHNYTAAPSSEPTSCSSTPSKRARVSHGGPPLKRIRINAHADSDLRSVVRKLHSGHSSHRNHHAHKSSSRSSSDSEDSEGRRAQHNVLERKRRNDLKSSFHTLRDRIPELNSQERAPKVVILKKATEHIWSLRRTHSKQQSELEHLQRTQEKLRRQLAQLQASS